MQERSIVPCLHAEWSSFVMLFGVPKDLTKKVHNAPYCSMVQSTVKPSREWKKRTYGTWTLIGGWANESGWAGTMYRNWWITRGSNWEIPNATKGGDIGVIQHDLSGGGIVPQGDYLQRVETHY